MAKQFRVFASYVVQAHTVVTAETEEEAMEMVEAGEYDELIDENKSDLIAEYTEEVDED